MPITQSDLVLLASQRLTQTPDGGGRRTGIAVQNGVDNNLFTDVSSFSSVYGAVDLCKAFWSVMTDDVDKYLGARVMLSKPPFAQNVFALLFAASATNDTRQQTTVRVESYMAPGAFYQGLLYGNHLAGMSTVMLIQHPDRTIPAIGAVMLLRKNEGLLNEFDQYVRITEVSSVALIFIDASGEFVKRVVTCTTSDPLREAFPGWQAQRIDSGLDFTGKTRVFDTVVADAAQYFGIRQLAQAASMGAFNIKTDSIFSSLLPSAQIETPIADARSNNVSAAMVASGNFLTQSLTLSFTPTQKMFIGGGIMPGSLTIESGGVTIADIGGGIMALGTNDVGAVDLENGIVSLSTQPWGNNGVGTYNVRYAPGARPDFVTQSRGIPVSINNRGLSWVMTLPAAPARGSLSVSYLANGRWYELRDNGVGEVRGSDTSLGAGTVNFVTGTVVVTLGALPDVGSAIVLQWAEAVMTTATAQSTQMLNGGRLYFAFNTNGDATEDSGSKMLSPNSVTVTWPDFDNTNQSIARYASDNGEGLLTGDAVGTVDYVKGVVRISPNTLPESGTVFSMASSSAATTASASPINLAGGSVGANVKPYSVSFPCTITVRHGSGGEVSNTNITKTVNVVDDGAGNFVFGDGANGNVQVGTINYATGVIAMAATVALGAIDMEGATVTTAETVAYQTPMYSGYNA